MKVQTSELIGHALDWIVAKLEEENDRRLTVFRREDYVGRPIERETEAESYQYEWWSPSRIWAQGGPIIEREGIRLHRSVTGQWWAGPEVDPHRPVAGPTPLIAAMRCYVTSKLGDEVDIPDELME